MSPRKRKRYTARVRWRRPADPRWEIETLHGGFGTATEAALFANGFLTRCPVALRIATDVELEYTDGTYEDLADDRYVIWHLPDSTDVLDAVADDASFQPVSPLMRRTMAGEGPWQLLAYGVLDAGGSPVDVVLKWDGAAELTVVEEPADGAGERAGDEASFEMGVLPRA